MSKSDDTHGETMEWSEAGEKYFLELLAEKVTRDANGTPIYKKSDWLKMNEKIFMKFGLSYGENKLKAKYNRLRIAHTKFGGLISHTGVTWNCETGRVEAAAEVWGGFTQRDKIFTTFKNRGCKLYSLMDLVFGKSTAKGCFKNPSTSGPQTSDEERRIEDNYMGEDANASIYTKMQKVVDVENSMVARKEKDLAKAKRIKAESSGGGGETSIDDCMTLLDAIPDVSTTSYNNALTRFLDAGWRRMFVLMPDARRKPWLETLND
ncbi:hypothetical protein CTI12_AA558530 [Artemisia annua]|uniref:Myb/SANT-like domain-containing protein n=1 Tax=Artemisia annua TaxID=35608 RepID=A0A2U1KVW6_ARTAN|nr:hypothetical protein CTI12_AA558530 [Artemisia annua]